MLGGSQAPEDDSFNPRPREGGDVRTGGIARVQLVSIHAPVRGATKLPRRVLAASLFQSTPP